MQPNQMIKQCLKINDQIAKGEKKYRTIRRLLQNIRASTNHSSSLLGSQEEFKLQHEAAGRVQVSWNTRSFSPSWPPRVHSRLSCFAQAFPSPGVHHIPLRIATSPSKPVVPILGCIGNHLGHLLKNPNALVAHRSNSIRMSGARNQASAFEKNPK